MNKSDPGHRDSEEYYKGTYGEEAYERLKIVRKRWAERYGQ